MFKCFNKPNLETVQDIDQKDQKMTHDKFIEQEYYRVGLTTDGRTTLTLIDSNKFSLTLSLTPTACERLIRILRSTYETDESTNDIPESQSA